jgi:cyclic pyranopterin phosphate synthase
MKAIDKSLEIGLKSVKVNVVVMKGFNEDEILDFAQFTRDRDLEVRFIEFMPFDSNSWNKGKLYPY